MASAVNVMKRNLENPTLPTASANVCKDTLILEMNCATLAIILVLVVHLLPNANLAAKIISES